eukprot:scaffold2820_cov64-Phaeocystis_antarctica.AAC.3
MMPNDASQSANTPRAATHQLSTRCGAGAAGRAAAMAAGRTAATVGVEGVFTARAACSGRPGSGSSYSKVRCGARMCRRATRGGEATRCCAEARSATAKRSIRLRTAEHASHTHTTACLGRSGACGRERHVEARAKPLDANSRRAASLRASSSSRCSCSSARTASRVGTSTASSAASVCENAASPARCKSRSRPCLSASSSAEPESTSASSVRSARSTCSRSGSCSTCRLRAPTRASPTVSVPLAAARIGGDRRARITRALGGGGLGAGVRRPARGMRAAAERGSDERHRRTRGKTASSARNLSRLLYLHRWRVAPRAPAVQQRRALRAVDRPRQRDCASKAHEARAAEDEKRRARPVELQRRHVALARAERAEQRAHERRAERGAEQLADGLRCDVHAVDRARACREALGGVVGGGEGGDAGGAGGHGGEAVDQRDDGDAQGGAHGVGGESGGYGEREGEGGAQQARAHREAHAAPLDKAAHRAEAPRQHEDRRGRQHAAQCLLVEREAAHATRGGQPERHHVKPARCAGVWVSGAAAQEVQGRMGAAAPWEGAWEGAVGGCGGRLRWEGAVGGRGGSSKALGRGAHAEEDAARTRAHQHHEGQRVCAEHRTERRARSGQAGRRIVSRLARPRRPGRRMRLAVRSSSLAGAAASGIDDGDGSELELELGGGRGGRLAGRDPEAHGNEADQGEDHTDERGRERGEAGAQRAVEDAAERGTEHRDQRT